MTQKDIRQLVEASYTKSRLDEKKVQKIAGFLSKAELKSYIRGLTLAEKKHKIYIALASKAIYNKKRKELEELFAGKEVVFREDPSLLLGMKVVDDDMVYELSLSDRLNKLTREVQDNY